MAPLTSGSDRRERASVHEAGHAVAALLLGVEVRRVSIHPAEGRLGECEFRASSSSALALGLVRAGGPAAELELFGRFDREGAREDLDAMRRFARAELPTRDPDDVAEWWISRTRKRLREEGWGAVRAVAQELERRTELSGPEAREVARSAGLALEESSPGARVVTYPTYREPNLEALAALLEVERALPPEQLFTDGRGFRPPGIRTCARAV